jgi:hypothetical protein
MVRPTTGRRAGYTRIRISRKRFFAAERGPQSGALLGQHLGEDLIQVLTLSETWPGVRVARPAHAPVRKSLELVDAFSCLVLVCRLGDGVGGHHELWPVEGVKQAVR